MSFPCQQIDSCPKIFSGYAANVNDGCIFSVSAGPDQTKSLGIICSSQGGPPSPCGSSGTWPVSPQGLPYNNSGNTSTITVLQGTVTGSGPNLVVTHGVDTWFLLNSVAVGDFQASYVAANLSQFNLGFFLMDGTQQIVYQFYFTLGDFNTAQANLLCSGIDGGSTNYATNNSIGSPSSPFTVKIIRSNTFVAFYVNSVLVLCADTGLTENANLGIYIAEFTGLNPTITSINAAQS